MISWAYTQFGLGQHGALSCCSFRWEEYLFRLQIVLSKLCPPRVKGNFNIRKAHLLHACRFTEHREGFLPVWKGKKSKWKWSVKKTAFKYLGYQFLCNIWAETYSTAYSIESIWDKDGVMDYTCLFYWTSPLTCSTLQFFRFCKNIV